ncbi:hypothetical protein ACFRFH_07650 [Leifsonia sp. NPDC056824]|uniref:hypothetical protein n=1 Tax=Leifsonia sp. NPDC056824 TaxID=3345953 RepID=UPI0036BD2646
MTDPQVSDSADFPNVEGHENTDRLRPNWLVRVVILLPCGLLTGSAVAAWLASPIGSGWDLAIIVFLACAYVVIRWMFFMGVRRDRAVLVATGAIWSRRIPLARIERVTDFHVFVRWRTRSGIRVFTPLVAFSAQEGSIESVANRNRWAIAQIRRWVQEQNTANKAQDDRSSSLNGPG